MCYSFTAPSPRGQQKLVLYPIGLRRHSEAAARPLGQNPASVAQAPLRGFCAHGAFRKIASGGVLSDSIHLPLAHGEDEYLLAIKLSSKSKSGCFSQPPLAVFFTCCSKSSRGRHRTGRPRALRDRRRRHSARRSPRLRVRADIRQSRPR